jgi:hypothetical protein
MSTIKFPCPYPPGGLCPPECITNDGPLCDFEDDCPYIKKGETDNAEANMPDVQIQAED